MLTRIEYTKPLKILLMSTKHNALSQRIALELQRKNYNIKIQEVQTRECMISTEQRENPDLIICPFLKTRIPRELWSRKPCLILHPGIEGDRGATSLDWAIKDKRAEWGATVLQADDQFDHGPIWSTGNFPMNRPDQNTLTKASVYGHEVTDTAAQCVTQAIEHFTNNTPPRTLDYSRAEVQGELLRNMRRQDRVINWDEEQENVARHVRMSDSSPGAIASFKLTSDSQSFWSGSFRAFGAHLETGDLRNLKGEPGQILGQRDNAILVKCGKGALWLSHLKCDLIKLPAMTWIRRKNPHCCDHIPVLGEDTSLPYVPYGQTPATFREVWVTMTADGVFFVNFNFYNGAMSTYQAKNLESILRRVEESSLCKVIVLKGGYNFFSNGINLNTIESSSDPVSESWNNINAINDVVHRIATSSKVTISALQGNAGAGGFMLSLASDMVVARQGVILNPHYRRMHLTGSEYHTYFLGERLGEAKASQLLDTAEPVLAETAAETGLVDQVMGNGVAQFQEQVEDLARRMARYGTVPRVTLRREERRKVQDFPQLLERHRAMELEAMARDFRGASYAEARRAFVLH